MSDPFELEILAHMPNYYGWIMETFSPHVRGHVVEYGAGTGTISQRLAPLADRLTLVEPSANLFVPLRARFRAEPKIDVVCETLEMHAARIGVASVDTVVMVNVLEHIENDRQALANLISMLRTGGHLLIFVPALQALMSKIDVVFGHFRRYHRNDLIEKVADAGGEVLLCRYFDLLGTLPWLVLNKIMGCTTISRAAVHINDTFVVPISRATERVFAPPLGKNLILVARRR